MFHISLGSGCFRHPNSEELVELMVASKADYPDLSEFGRASIRKMWEWESRNGYASQSLEETLQMAVNRSAGSEEIAEMLFLLQNLYWVDLIDFHKEEIIKVIVLFEPKWNLKTFAVETQENYIYVEWGTTA